MRDDRQPSSVSNTRRCHRSVWYVVGAGRVFASSRWQPVARLLREHDVPHEIVAVDDPLDLTSRIADLRESGATQFVSVGGDGAANLLVNALLNADSTAQSPPLSDDEQPPTLAFIPLGTGCDFCRSLHLPRDPRQAARALLPPVNTVPCDVGVAEGKWGTRYFLNVAAVGLTAAAVRTAAKCRWLGSLRYLAAFWAELPRFSPREFRVHLGQCADKRSADRDDAASQSGRGLATIVANGRFFGDGFPIAPTANLRDSQLEILQLFGGRWALPSIVWHAARGTHLQAQRINHARCREILVECQIATPVEVDGDYLGETPVRFHVLPDRIRTVSLVSS